MHYYCKHCKWLTDYSRPDGHSVCSSTGVKIITQQVQPSKILPKPSSVALSSSSSSPIMVVSSNGAIMTTKLVTQPTGGGLDWGRPTYSKTCPGIIQSSLGKESEVLRFLLIKLTVFFVCLLAATQATYTRPTVSPIGARISASSGGTTYVKTTSGSIITVVPKSLATLGGKIISSNIVSGKSRVWIDQLSVRSHQMEKKNRRLVSADRNHHKDNHHTHDLQAKCHRGSEDHREGSDHPGPPRQERGHHAAKRRGQSGDTNQTPAGSRGNPGSWSLCNITTISTTAWNLFALESQGLNFLPLNNLTV